ncbi:MAG: hypothetical protein Q9157_005980 [Trypethelium eluteriae]
MDLRSVPDQASVAKDFDIQLDRMRGPSALQLRDDRRANWNEYVRSIMAALKAHRNDDQGGTEAWRQSERLEPCSKRSNALTSAILAAMKDRIVVVNEAEISSSGRMKKSHLLTDDAMATKQEAEKRKRPHWTSGRH